MKTFSMTHIGRRREMNQDYMYTSENAVGKLPNLFLVADGMGGHKAGESVIPANFMNVFFVMFQTVPFS